MKLAGIDGCRAGWVIATSDTALGTIEYFTLATDAIGQIFAAYAAEGSVIAIDIPIGLSDKEARACDLAARRYLQKPRASSVFPAPCRAALPATSYHDACALNQKASGRGMSRQTFEILPKIRSVDEAITPELQRHIRETHPEVVFARLKGEWRGLTANKRTAAGRRLRRELLEGRLRIAIDVDAIRDGLGRSKVSTDDLLDAVACLVTAQNVATGNAIVLPNDAVARDRHGLCMEIVA